MTLKVRQRKLANVSNSNTGTIQMESKLLLLISNSNFLESITSKQSNSNSSQFSDIHNYSVLKLAFYDFSNSFVSKISAVITHK